MGKKNLGQRVHYVPLLAAAQLSSTTSLKAVNAGLFNQVEFIIQLGALATADFTLTLEECTAAAGTGATAVAGEYRVSAAAGTDTMGAVTTLATSGLALANATMDDMCVIATIDSDALSAGYNYVRPTLTRAGSATAYASIVAVCHPRYQQETPSLALS